MFVAIWISKEHFNTTEMKDWVFKSLIDEIAVYLGNFANSPSFPELTLGITSVLWKFKKTCQNPIYCKIIAALLLWV